MDQHEVQSQLDRYNKMMALAGLVTKHVADNPIPQPETQDYEVMPQTSTSLGNGK